MNDKYKFLLLYRRTSPVSHEAETRSWVFETQEEVAAFVAREQIGEADFIGLWELGEPLPLKIAVSTEEVQKPETVTRHELVTE